MGTSFSNPQFTATNYSLDYSCNLLRPGQNQVMQRMGPNAAAFPDQGKNQLLSDMNTAISTADPQAVAEYNRYQTYIYIAFGCFVLGIVMMIVFSSAVYGGTSYGVVFVIIFWIVGIVAICTVQAKQRTAAFTWRSAALAIMQQKLQVWKQTYPAFTFTIIWPVEVWRRSRSRSGHGRSRSRRRLVAIWVYVRVTQGPCQTGANEPIYATSSNVVAPTTGVVIQQPMVMQQQQPVVYVDQNGNPIQQPIQQQPVVVQQPVQQQQILYVDQNGNPIQQPVQQQVVQQPVQQQQILYVDQNGNPIQQPIQQQQPVVVQQPVQQQVQYQQPQNPSQDQAFNPDINSAPPDYQETNY